MAEQMKRWLGVWSPPVAGGRLWSVLFTEAEVQRGHVTCPASWAGGSRWQQAADPGLGGLHGQCPSCHAPAASKINLKESRFLSNGSCTGSRAGRNICFLIPALPPELHGINPSPGHVADGSSARGAETVSSRFSGPLVSWFPGALTRLLSVVSSLRARPSLRLLGPPASS